MTPARAAHDVRGCCREDNPMNRVHYGHFIFGIVAACGLVIALSLAGTAQTGVPTSGPPTDDSDVFPPHATVKTRDRKQQQTLLKSYLDNMRKDAAELAKLANSIQEDLEKTTENELPLRVVTKAEQVEKLAKRIKNTAKGF